jgi:serine phosphatase RsbU (regulator of sigma subunit)/PAS domain-containing protein
MQEVRRGTIGGRGVAVAQTYAQALDLLRPPARPATAEAGRMVVERAAALLAGRARCRVAEAHRQLLRMAADWRRDLIDVSHGVIRLLDVADPAAEPERPPTVPELVAAALAAPPAAGRFPPEPDHRFDPTIAMIQRVLDVTPGMCGYLTAQRDDAGGLVDLVWRAASPEARTTDGRRGSQLVGERILRNWPGARDSERWAIYRAVLDTGCPAVVGPFRHDADMVTVRVHRLGEGLLLNWNRLDDPASESERVAGTERLGNLGWGEWDLVSGEVYWSSQLYRIYERDPSLGPLSQAESEAMNLPEDEPLRQAAMVAFGQAEQVDIITRIRLGDRVKHLRTVADAVRDAAGRPLRVYGIVQDVTDRENAARRLAEVERQLADEHELAGSLQRIILPIPDGPIDLPGMRVALRYLPAGKAGLVGGDWFEATRLRDGSVLLAVGDVAGHGIPAATTMAQLRHALRALAVTTGDPGELLGHLNRFTCDLERDNPELSATAVVARFCPAAQEIVWAQAGHPPPLLCRDGRTAALNRPAGPMLGVVDDAAYPTARLAFRAGDVLLLYTDGLVEHRRLSLDDGLAQVIRVVDDAVRTSPQQPLAHLLDRLRQANPEDDTCILAARPVPADPAPAAGRAMAAVR